MSYGRIYVNYSFVKIYFLPLNYTNMIIINTLRKLYLIFFINLKTNYREIRSNSDRTSIVLIRCDLRDILLLHDINKNFFYTLVFFLLLIKMSDIKNSEDDKKYNCSLVQAFDQYILCCSIYPYIFINILVFLYKKLH